MWKKKENKTLNQYDEWYKEARTTYGNGIRALKDAFFNVRATNNLRNQFGWDSLDEAEQSANIKFKLSYNVMDTQYKELVHYYEKHGTEMDSCKTWNTSLLSPLQFMIRWERECLQR